jgi:hypothetical protein
LVFQDIQNMFEADLVKCFLDVDKAKEGGSVKFPGFLG